MAAAPAPTEASQSIGIKSGKESAMILSPLHQPPHILRSPLTWILLVALATSTREQDPNAPAPLAPAESDTKVKAAVGEDGMGQVPVEAVLPTNRAICPKCQDRSVCLVSSAGNASCFCPPDRTGEFCEVELVKFPTECSKDQCENGGICEQGPGTTICFCSENYAGKNCSRVAVWIALSMNLYSDGRLVEWAAQNKSKTAISLVACNQLTAAILRGSNPTIATAFVDCDLQNFEKVRVDNQEGIRVSTLLKFDPGNNPKVFQEVEVRRHLELSPVDINFDADETISITNYDVCKGDKHDCSPSASCIWDGTTYTCECNKFFTDGFVMGKVLPGRECYHSFMSGLLLGCLIILPILIVTFVGLFYCRRYQAKKEWISTTEASDALQLVASQYPKYDA